MKTRTDYMNGMCTHYEYYSQFVTPQIKNLVLHHIGDAAFLNRRLCEDRNLNNIPCCVWDTIVLHHKYVGIIDEQNDGRKIYSLSNGVCVLKCAAQMIVDESAE